MLNAGSTVPEIAREVVINDEPIKLPQQDELRREKFARQMATTLTALPDDATFVIGVYGAWGSGKTSILNLYKHFLRSADPTALVLEYSPWSITTDGDIVQQFLQLLRNELSSRGDANLRALGDVLDQYASLLADASTNHYITLAAKAVKWAGKALRIRHDVTLSSMESLKGRLAELFRRQSSRIYVIIDDIDRLSVNEALRLFQLVKAVANLPNVTYILAFDRKFIGEQIAAQYRGNGHAFIDKIVQLPLNIPEPDVSDLNELWVRHVQSAIKCAGAVFESQYFKMIFDSGVLLRFNTVRDIKRFANLLHFRHKIIEDEVDPIDLIALTLIQYFDDSAFSALANMRAILAPQPFTAYLMADDDGLTKESIDRVLGSFKNNADILSMLFAVFPFMRIRYMRSKNYAENPLFSGNQTLRAFRPESFARYFTMALSAAEISETSISQIITTINDPSVFINLLKRLVVINASETFTKIAVRSRTMDQDRVRRLAILLLQGGDEIVRSIDNANAASSDFLVFIMGILQNIDAEARMSALTEATSALNSATYTTTILLSLLQRQLEAPTPTQIIDAQQPLMDETRLEVVIETWRGMLEQKAARGDLAVSNWRTLWPRLFHVLSTWATWDQQAARTTFRKVTHTDDDFIAFLDQLVAPGVDAPGLLPHTMLRRFLPHELLLLISADDIVQRAKEISASHVHSMSQRQRHVIKAFSDAAFLE